MENILGKVLQIGLGLLGLSFLVFIHELGHFLVAKKYGVRVKVFSIGFGKRLFTIRRGETEYCISMIPFGGYVAMAGENPAEENSGPQEGDFNIQPIRVRAAIAFGGPAVNIIFAFLTLWALYMYGVSEPVEDRLVVGVIEESSPAELAGILKGDTIIAVDGQPARGWQKFRETIGISLGAPVPLQVLRNSDTLNIAVVPTEFRDMGVGHAGLHPRHRVVIPVSPEEGRPAHTAGLRKGDTILQVDGRYVSSYDDVAGTVNAAKGTPVRFLIERSGDTLSFELTPEFHAEENRWMVGVLMGLHSTEGFRIVRRNPIEAFVKAGSSSVDMATSIFRYLGRMIEGQIKMKALSGPVGIVPIIGLSWMESFGRVLMILALISMNLGVMNLLPLAITDGGLLMFLGLEALRGKPLSRKVQARIQQIATLLFITLFLYITTQDLSRFGMFLK